jgi:hypothetical protein
MAFEVNPVSPSVFLGPATDADCVTGSPIVREMLKRFFVNQEVKFRRRQVQVERSVPLRARLDGQTIIKADATS